MKVGIKKYLIEISEMLFGSLIMAFAIVFFLLPNQLSSGGFSGISTVIYYLTKVPIGTINIILNVPIFAIAYFKLGKKFFIKTIFGTMFLSLFLNLLSNFNAFHTDRVLGCIYGGIFMGIGTSFILKAEATTGGTELLTNLIREYRPDITLSQLIVIIDTIVVIINVIFFKQIEVGLYSAITIYIMGRIIDLFFEGIYFSKMIMIVSKEYEEIAEKIGKELKRGTTGIYSKGMYTNEERMLILCVVSRNELYKVRKIIKETDEFAFTIISNAREVFGKGFKEANIK